MGKGEMISKPLSENSECVLPRGGGVAYAAQESWVMNETIRVPRGSLPVPYPGTEGASRRIFSSEPNMMSSVIRRVWLTPSVRAGS